MGKFRGVDDDEGWILRYLRKHDQQIRELRSARSLQASSIGKGGITVQDGGGITVEGGQILVEDGSIRVTYPDGSDALFFGIAPQDDGSGGTIPEYRFAVYDTDGSLMLSTKVRPPWSLEPDGFKSAGLVAADSEVSVADGNVYAWRPESADGLTVDDSSAQLTSAAGHVLLQGSSGVRISHATTANAANAYLDPTNGTVSRSTSSRRYKRDITDADLDAEALLRLTPRRFRSKAEVAEQGADAPEHVGFIAEEAADLGLGEFVTSDDEGPEAFSYPAYVVGLQAIVQHQAQQIADLTARLERLEQAGPDEEP